MRRGNSAGKRKFVVVGTAPPLEDVLSGAYKEPPFDLDSFSAYATKTFFAENLAFLEEVSRVGLPTKYGFKPSTAVYRSVAGGYSSIGSLLETTQVNPKYDVNSGPYDPPRSTKVHFPVNTAQKSRLRADERP